jgi:hypothetical protein
MEGLLAQEVMQFYKKIINKMIKFKKSVVQEG